MRNAWNRSFGPSFAGSELVLRSVLSVSVAAPSGSISLLSLPLAWILACRASLAALSRAWRGPLKYFVVMWAGGGRDTSLWRYAACDVCCEMERDVGGDFRSCSSSGVQSARMLAKLLCMVFWRGWAMPAAREGEVRWMSLKKDPFFTQRLWLCMPVFVCPTSERMHGHHEQTMAI